MNTEQMQVQVDKLSGLLLQKEVSSPKVQLQIEANMVPCVMLRWSKSERWLGEEYEFVRGDDVAAALDKAEMFIRQMPSLQEANKNEFLKALGQVIDLGRKHGIETDYINPLAETMKRLAENALTEQAA